VSVPCSFGDGNVKLTVEFRQIEEGLCLVRKFLPGNNILHLLQLWLVNALGSQSYTHTLNETCCLVSLLEFGDA
jgi:hypothetical protein